MLIVVFSGVLRCLAVADAATVQVMPASVTAAVEEVVSLTVSVDTVADLGGFQFGFSFDPRVAEVAAITLNSDFNWQIRKYFDNVTGKGIVAAISFANPVLTGADLSLATIDFRIKGIGATDVMITNYILGHSDGEQVPTTATGSRLTSSGIVGTIPVISINSPASGMTAVAVPVLDYQVSDGVVTVKVDGTVVATRYGEALAALADGPHSLRIESVNAAGLGFAEVSFTIDTVKPVLKYFALPSGDYPINVALAITVPVIMSASDNIKIADYCLNVSGNPGACSWSPTAPALHTFGSFGPHTLYAFARDAAGNISTPLSATVTVVPTATLKVVLNGTGGGAVTGPVAGITCSAPPLAGVCTADFPLNTNVTLSAAPTGSALFSGWGGACTGTGSCTLKLTGNLTAAATFASPQSVRLSCTTPPKYYVSLQQAYTEAPDGCVIQALAGVLRENLAVDQNKVVTIKGGYDTAFTTNVGTTGLTGSLSLINGTAILENLALIGATLQSPDVATPQGSITINQGAATTKSPLVTVDLKAADPGGVTGQCLSNTADCTVWESYSGTSLPWLLPEGDGPRSVNAWFRDSAGNTTTLPVTASIVLDMTPPTVQTFTLPEGDYPLEITLPITVPVTLVASDNLQLDGVCLTEAGVPASCTWTPISPDKFTFGSYGPHTLYAFARDTAGNISEPLAKTVTILPTASLTVEISGTGGGSVTSSPSGITCTYPPVNAVCTAEFPFNSMVSLLPAPNGDSLLTAWGVACSGAGACEVKMADNLGVTAVLTYVEPVQLACTTPPKRYTLLQQAYDEAPNGCLIQVRAITLSGDLALNAAKSVSIRGGYDTSFANIIGMTGLKGKLSILKGGAVVEYLEIR